MAKARPSVQKRNRELRKQEKREAKAASKAHRDAEREDEVEVADHVDPDLAGITPGPQTPIWDQLDVGV